MEITEVWLVTALLASCSAFDYCQLASCPGGSHTACKFSLGPSSKCSKDANKLSQEERAAILRQHNDLRGELAAGKVDGFLRALDLETLEWDTELENIAQTWADQCTYRHDDCRNVERWHVGQNIALTGRSDKFQSEIEKKVRMWWDEYKQYSYKDGTFKFTSGTGHFTQMAWAKTNRLGCGRSTYVDGRFTNEYLVCNYGPGGNVNGMRMYTAGSKAAHISFCLWLLPLLKVLLMMERTRDSFL